MQSKDIADLPMNFAKKVMSTKGEPKGFILREVPNNIWTASANPFVPKIVSLGPHRAHFGERIKWFYAKNFFRRIVGKDDTNLEQQYVIKRFTDLTQGIFERFKNLELDSRRAYGWEINMTSIKFLEMMMLDCVFMTEFLLLQREIKNRHWTEIEEYYYYYYPWKWATPFILNDMLLLHNQVPLFLLTEHVKFTMHQTSVEFFFEDFILQIHRNLSPTSNGMIISSCSLLSNETSANLLHSFYLILVSELRKKASHLLHTVQLPSFPNAEMLQAMRIEFTNKTDCSSFLDITFDERKRSMGIPQLLIEDQNIVLLQNLIGFEHQYCHGVGFYISAYVWFMNCLINTGKDVAVLRKHNIIVSRLHSDEEVCRIFNELRKTDATVVDFDHFYLAEVMIQVDSYCRNRSNRLWALRNFSWLRQKYYFKNNRWPWVTIGVTAFVIFNLFTLVKLYMLLSVTPIDQ